MKFDLICKISSTLFISSTLIPKGADDVKRYQTGVFRCHLTSTWESIFNFQRQKTVMWMVAAWSAEVELQKDASGIKIGSQTRKLCEKVYLITDKAIEKAKMAKTLGNALKTALLGTENIGKGRFQGSKYHGSVHRILILKISHSRMICWEMILSSRQRKIWKNQENPRYHLMLQELSDPS